jgi:hypothetical protein
MAAMPALLALLALLTKATAATPNITVQPTTVPTELPTQLWVTLPSGFAAATSSQQAICSIKSLDNTFVGYEYRAVGDYNCLKRVPATVHNATHLSCRTVRLHNSAPATLRVSLDNGTTWLPGTPRVVITPLVEVAVGRRPYTSESEGQLVVKVAGAPLLPPGTAVQLTARLPSAVHTPKLALSSAGRAVSGGVSLLSFPLGTLPPTVFADLTITATIPGHGTVEYHLRVISIPAGILT